MAESPPSTSYKPCPFCAKPFKGLGNHLRHCKQRDGRDYQAYLSEKTRKKLGTGSKKKTCSRCGKAFVRLDTHLRNSARCRAAPSCPLPSQPSQMSQVTSDAGLVDSPIASPFQTQYSHPQTPYNHPTSPEEWASADEALARTVVPAVMAATSADEKNEALCQGIYSYFSSTFGTRKQRTRKRNRHHAAPKVNLALLKQRRNKARNDLRRAKKQGSSPDNITSLATAFHKYLREYNKVVRAEKRSEDLSNARAARTECSKNFARFAKKVLEDDNQNIIHPGFSQETAEQFFSSVYSCTPKAFAKPSWLPNAPLPCHPFEGGDFTAQEVSDVLRKVRAQSAPSPLDQIRYRVLKHCPSLLSALLDLFQFCWSMHTIPSGWKEGVIHLIPKASARENPRDPGNFRPIALTSCVGKLFTSLLKNRWLRFMTSNGYLDTSLQKAFIPGVPGCLEQYEKLSAMIKDAHTKHKSLTVCWFDLANAFGSVHHQLIDFCLHHYHAPVPFISTLRSLYSNLSATVSTGSWSTRSIPLQIGVYQGDPLSVAIFNTVMVTLTDALKANKQLGYRLAGKTTSNVLQYADDTCIVANGPANCQAMLDKVQGWLQWTGMVAKVPKCKSLGILASSGKRLDPKLHLNGESISFIGTLSFRFLGGPVQVPMDSSQHRAHLVEKLHNLLLKVDNSMVTSKQKLLLYRAGVCPRLTWDLSILDLPITWVTRTLESMATRYIKKWSGVCRSANTAYLYLPRDMGGLGLPTITLLYKKLKISQATLLLTSRDPVSQQVVKGKLGKEKHRPHHEFKAMQLSQETMAEDPGAARHVLLKRAKAKITLHDAVSRADSAKALPKQGQLLREGSDAGAGIWASAVALLSPAKLKFALNAATDTLPHNQNLALWGEAWMQVVGYVGSVNLSVMSLTIVRWL